MLGGKSRTFYSHTSRTGGLLRGIFTAVEVLIVLVVISAVGFVGWRVYDSNSDTIDTNETPQQVNNSTASESTPETAAQAEEEEDGSAEGGGNNKKYFVITEWGVKFDLRNYDKLSYSYSSTAGKLSTIEADFDSSAAIEFLPAAVTNTNCEPGLSIYRSTKKPANSSDFKMIGNYYYFITGSPGLCDGNPQSNDNVLKSAFVEDFTTTNLSKN